MLSAKAKALDKVRSAVPTIGFVTCRSILCVALAGVAVACGEPSDSGRHPALRVVDDTVWAAGVGWRVEQELRIGADSGESSDRLAGFGRVFSIAADAEGRIYVADAMREVVEVFEQDGTPVRAIGGRGSGPGEFHGLRAVSVVSDEVIIVTDDGNARYTSFSQSGDLQDTFWRPIVGFSSDMLGGPMPSGGFLDWAFRFPDGRAGAVVEFLPIVFSPDFSVADTFPPVRGERELVVGGSMPQLYYGRATIGAIDGGGHVWFAHSDEYRLYKRTLRGDTLLILQLLADPAPVTPADREAVAENSQLRPDLLQRQLENIPKNKPLLQRIVANRKGHILVFVDIAGEVAGTAIDVFTEQGEYLGRTHMPNPIRYPARTSPPVVYAESDHLYIVEHDRLDVPYVVRLRIADDPGSD
jgi:hypothetical protein